MAGDPDKAALIAELAAARGQIAQAGQALEQAGASLKKKLDLPSRIQASYANHKPAWLGAAGLLGLILSRLPTKKKVVYVERSTGETLGSAGKLGALWGLAKFVGTLAKPLLSNLAVQRAADFAQRFATGGRAQNPPPPRDSTDS
jgi:hypothetical protein